MTITVVFFIKFVTLSFSKESHCNMQGRLYRNTGPGRKSVLGPLLPFFRESSGGGVVRLQAETFDAKRVIRAAFFLIGSESGSVPFFCLKTRFFSKKHF